MLCWTCSQELGQLYVSMPVLGCTDPFAVQVVQLFDSWAHVLTPQQFAEYSLPYAQKVIDGVRAQRPGTPLMFHANGGTPPSPSAS